MSDLEPVGPLPRREILSLPLLFSSRMALAAGSSGIIARSDEIDDGWEKPAAPLMDHVQFCYRSGRDRKRQIV